MRWSAIKVGLSGTSLALSIGCQTGNPEGPTEIRAAEIVAQASTEASRDASAKAEEEEARSEAARKERALAREVLPRSEDRRLTEPASTTSWFLNPPGSTGAVPPSTVVVTPLVTAPPVVTAPPIHTARPPGWNSNMHRACGRG